MNPQTNLSIIVLTHNDEEHLVDCLELLNFGDELIIIDDESTDRSTDIAKNYTKKVFIRPLNNNFSNQRNFALNNAHGNWVLFVDSDEFISEKLRDEILSKIKQKDEILSKIKQKDVSGYYMRRIDFMWGKKILHGEVGEIRLMRLAKRDSGKWHGKVHEEWRVSGTTGTLTNPLVHAPHQSVKEFIKEVDLYSSLRAEELRETNGNSNFFLIIMYPLGKFVQNYFFKKGYKDGVAGFIYAMIMSFHSFLVRGKLYLGKTDTEKVS